jgi:flagellar basal body P-ring protein FlgI
MKVRLALMLGGVLICIGCSTWQHFTSFRSQSPDKKVEKETKPLLVGDLAVPFGMHVQKVEGITVVSGLRGTGSDPRPGPQREVLLSHMQTRGVTSPNTLLSSNNVSLVLVRGILRPGIQKGDRFDLDIRVPSQSDTTSLRGGWLMPVDLQELAVMQDNQIHNGKVFATAEGPVLVDPAAHGKQDRVLLCRGRVLGGGVAKESRNLGLVLKPEDQSIINSSRVETAVNRRFHSYTKGVKTGVAKAMTDQFIELKVHPKYKDNIDRYVQVVRALPLRESEAELAERLPHLEQQLFDPETSARAALQLEAMGKRGVDTLRKGLKAVDAEVRFYSAEALAYMDETGEAEVLAQTAKTQPAFRVFALAALAQMDDMSASEQLRGLLNVPSAETRYGAFRALWTMNHEDPMVMGENLKGQFSYHVLATDGPSMVHVTKSKRPEVVLFGNDLELTTPIAVEAGNQIMITSSKPGEITISRFAVREPDQKRFVSTRVDEVIRAIVELGGHYPDVVQALQEAKAQGCLAARFEVDALPEAGRSYDRSTDSKSDDDKTDSKADSKKKPSESDSADDDDAKSKPKPKKKD